MKTSELTDRALDYAVAKCNQDWTDEDRWYNTIGYVDSGDPDDEPYDPSTNWALGGPIIEREKIEIRESNGKWIAMWWANNSGMAKNPTQRFEFNYMTHGPTPLVAAMRAYVASRFGDEVEIPEELQGELA